VYSKKEARGFSLAIGSELGGVIIVGREGNLREGSWHGGVEVRLIREEKREDIFEGEKSREQ